MIFEAKYQGKWVACKDDKVIADSSSFNGLNKKVEKIGNPEEFIYTFVPKGFICPSLWCETREPMLQSPHAKV